MKVWAWLVFIPLLGSFADAQSLGDAAKRERERREKKGQASPAPVINDEALVAGRGKATQGTFNGSASSASSAPSAPSESSSSSVSLSPSPSPEGASDGPRSDVDIKRAAARDRLASSYAAIRSAAGSLAQAVRDYERCGGPTTPGQSSEAGVIESDDCQAKLINVGRLAISIGLSMEDAEDAARQGWLQPGDVRAARQRNGMDDQFWDDLVQMVRQYRR